MEILINNSFSRIMNATSDQLNRLREATSYLSDPTAAFFAGGRARRNYLISKKGEFSTGLLYRVYDEIHKLGINNTTTIDKTVVPKPKDRAMFNLKLPGKPYQQQINAVNRVAFFGRGAINMPTGSGKSWTMAMLINKLQLKTLVIVPNLELKRQLSETFTQLFGSLDNITIENIASPSLLKATDYDVLIIDEAHHGASKTYRNLNKKAWNNIYYRYFFTATPFRSKDEEQMLLESIIGTVLYELSYKEALEANMVCRIEAYYIDLPKTKVEGHTWTQVYNQLIVNNEKRNDIIFQFLVSLASQKIKSLCLVKEIKHGNNIASDVFTFANGQDELTEKYLKSFNTPNETSVLIGTSGVVGEGIDTRLAEFVIIAGLGKSKNAFMQQVGRVMRTLPGKVSGKVILFRDPSHKWTLAHFKAQCKILKEEYGIIPMQLHS